MTEIDPNGRSDRFRLWTWSLNQSIDPSGVQLVNNQAKNLSKTADLETRKAKKKQKVEQQQGTAALSMTEKVETSPGYRSSKLYTLINQSFDDTVVNQTCSGNTQNAHTHSPRKKKNPSQCDCGGHLLCDNHKSYD